MNQRKIEHKALSILVWWAKSTLDDERAAMSWHDVQELEYAIAEANKALGRVPKKKKD